MHFDHISRTISKATGHPWVFAASFALIIGWAAVGPWFGWSDSHSLFINTATTIITFLMVFVLQNSQNRDSAAIQAKLDELIRAVDKARNEFIGLDEQPSDAIQRARDAVKTQEE